MMKNNTLKYITACFISPGDKFSKIVERCKNKMGLVQYNLITRGVIPV